MNAPAHAISASDYEFVQSLLRRRAAIVLDSAKEYLVEARLNPVAQRLGFPSLADLVNELRVRPTPDLQQHIVEAMTIHETIFFRDWKPFETLRTHILPDLIKARERVKKLNIWSAASSTGQEPYSIAMLIREHFPELRSWAVNILATDVSRAVLAQARLGRFSQLEVNRGMPARMLTRYFKADGAGWQLADEIRSMVDFRELNLAGKWPMMPRMDIVLVRNVMIYFDPPTRRSILANVRDTHATDGVLALGCAESAFGITDDYVAHPQAANWYVQKNRGEITL